MLSRNIFSSDMTIKFRNITNKSNLLCKSVSQTILEKSDFMLMQCIICIHFTKGELDKIKRFVEDDGTNRCLWPLGKKGGCKHFHSLHWIFL